MRSDNDTASLMKTHIFPCDLSSRSPQCFQSLWCRLCQQNCTSWKVNAWVLLLLFFNMAFEFLSAFISGKQWHHEYQGQLPRHLCRETVREIAVSVACWWVHSVFDFCIWNRDVKLVRPLDCQKEAELNHSSLDLFCASSALVLSTVALYCPYQGHKWVRDGAGNS